MTVYKAKPALNAQQLKTRALYQSGVRPTPSFVLPSKAVRRDISERIVRNTLNAPDSLGFCLA